MIETTSPAYVFVVSLLFVPWVYGLVSMERDIKNRVLPVLYRIVTAQRGSTNDTG